MFETTLAGSLPKPSWLATPNVLWAPWTLSGAPLLDAKDDATLLAIRRQEEAGLDIVSDGEQARQHFVHGFLAEVDGVDFNKKVRMGIRNNRYDADCPTVTAALRRRKFVHEREARVAKRRILDDEGLGVVVGVKDVGQLAQVVRQGVRCAIHRRLLDDLRVAGQGLQHGELVRAAETRGGRGESDIPLEVEAACGKLFHDTRDARMGVLDVVDGILVAA